DVAAAVEVAQRLSGGRLVDHVAGVVGEGVMERGHAAIGDLHGDLLGMEWVEGVGGGKHRTTHDACGCHLPTITTAGCSGKSRPFRRSGVAWACARCASLH